MSDQYLLCDVTRSSSKPGLFPTKKVRRICTVRNDPNKALFTLRDCDCESNLSVMLITGCLNKKIWSKSPITRCLTSNQPPPELNFLMDFRFSYLNSPSTFPPPYPKLQTENISLDLRFFSYLKSSPTLKMKLLMENFYKTSLYSRRLPSR